MSIDPRLLRLLEDLRASRGAAIQGARLSVSIPLAEAFLNEVLGIVVPPTAPVRKLSVRPLANNQLAVTGTVVAAPFLPPLSLTFEIESQPAAPDWRLGLRMHALPGFMSLAGSMFKLDSYLPPGITLVGPRLAVDLQRMLDARGLADLLTYADALRVRSDAGRLTIDAELSVK